MIKIAVDSMGSDNSPFSEVEGAVQAARAFDVNVILVGKESLLAPLLKEAGGAGLPIEIRNATQVIAMDEAPTAALRKKGIPLFVSQRISFERRSPADW